MHTQYSERNDPEKSKNANASYCQVPIVAHSPSFQQPEKEAMELSMQAFRNREIQKG